MKRDLKKAFSFILVLALVIGLIPAPVSLAAPGPKAGLEIINPGVSNTVLPPAKITDGAIWTNKDVSHLGNGEFQITLSAIGQNYKLSPLQNPYPLDVILVLDFSGSMTQNPNPNKLRDMKASAITAASIFLGIKDNRVGVVTYNTTATELQGLTSSLGAVTKKITDNTQTQNATNIQDALYVAHNMIKNRGVGNDSRHPVIILMTDGVPNRYYESLDHSTSVQSGATNGDAESIWWTIEQAKYTQTNGTPSNYDDDIAIYTIGFNVTGDAARATLAPTEENTYQYRLNKFIGETRTATQSGKVQYYATRTNNGEGSWSSWSPSTTSTAVTGLTYLAPIGLTTAGLWTAYSVVGDNISAPTTGNWSSWSPASLARTTTMLSDPPVVNSNWTNSNGGYYRTRAGFYNASQTRMEYRNITGGKIAFDHKYWTKSTITEDASLDSILQAFVDLANQLTTFAPTQVVTSGPAAYNNITVNDTIGTGFEIVEPRPAGLTYNSTTGAVTWVIDGKTFSDYNSMNPGSTSIDVNKFNKISFRVKINNSVGSGTYQTNSTAGAIATVAAENPAYNTNTFKQPLPTTGYLTLKYTPVDATITIEKTVTGAAVGTTTFAFNVYDADMSFLTSASIAITGADTRSTSVSLKGIPGEKFVNGEATFFVQEIGTAPKFWTYDLTKKSVGITRDNRNVKVSFTNSYNPKGTLTVNKVWPQGNPDNITSVAFYLESKVGDGPWSRDDSLVPYTLTADGGWAYPIPGLSLSKDYRVVEIPGYLTQDYYSTTTPGSISFDANNLERTITISNKYITPTGDITIKKNWIGGAVEDLPDYVNFDYDYSVDGTKITSGSISLDSSEATVDDGVLTWKLKKSGLGFGTYTFTERDVQDYKATTATSQAVSIAKEPYTSRSAVVTFENTYTTPSGTLVVEKEWVGDNGNTKFRPSGIVVQLFQKLTGMTEPVAYDGPVTLSVANDWMATYKNLVWGEYSIKEISDVPDYSTTYSALSVTLAKGTKNNTESRSNTITISNLFNNPTGKITVQKTWVESGLSMVDRPSEITITLYRNGQYRDSVTFGGIDASYTFTGLPLDGTYTVAESASSEEDIAKLSAYKQAVLYSSNGNGIKLSPSPFEREGTAFLRNTCARGTITVNKAWEDGENPALEQPTAAAVTLYQKITKIVEEEMADYDNPIVNDEDGTTSPGIIITTHSATTVTAIENKLIDRSASPANYSVVFKDLPLGEEYSYYVKETPVAFYDTIYSHYDEELKETVKSDEPEDISLTLTEGSGDDQTSANGVITITNTYKDPKGELTVSKQWIHGNSPTQPSEVTVKLYEVLADESLVYITEAAFVDHYTFKGLTLGAVYTVKEKDVNQYRTSYSAINYKYNPEKNYNTERVDSDSIGITNEYIPETGSLQVTKKWEGKIGKEVTIILTRYYTADGALKEDTAFNEAPPSVLLNEGNQWTDTFDGLDVYGPGGVKYDYRAVESGTDLWMYTPGVIQDKQLTAKGQAELTITNTYTPTQGALTIKKNWQNGSDYPSTINYKLYVDGEPQDGYRTLSAPDWTEVLTGLDVTHTYSVKELNVPEEYNVSYSVKETEKDSVSVTDFIAQDAPADVTFTNGHLSWEITMTNTRTESTPRLVLTKEVDKEAVILDSDGKAQFTYRLTIENTGNRTLTNVYVDDQMTASGTAVAANIAYVTSGSLDLVGANGAKIIPLKTTLERGASTTAIYTVIVDQAGEYNNIATAYGNYGETSVPSAPAQKKAIVKDLDLQIEKTVLSERNIIGYGGNFIYQITVRNASDFDFSGVNVRDVMTSTNPDATMSYTNGGEVEYLPDEHRFVIGTLPAGSEDVVFTYTVSVSGTGTYDNTAKVTGYYENELGSGTRTDIDQESVTVTRRSRPDPNPDPKPNPDPDDPDIIIPDEDVPQAPVILEDEAVPAGPLPKTGGIPAAILFGAGALLAGGGLGFKRKENKTK